MKKYVIGLDHWSINTIEEIINKNYEIELSDEAKSKIIECRNYLDKAIETSESPIYGINTGFGSLCNTKIYNSNLEKLQENLVMSHACGVGDEISSELVKLMILLKIKALSYGKSAVSIKTVERLIFYYNNDILPVVYKQGSLGASGDLAPLAHITLTLIGKGEVYFEGKKLPTSEVLKLKNLPALKLKSKEGLALMNGTQFMLAHAVHAIIRAKKIVEESDKIAALSLEAYLGRIEPFFEILHTIRPHKGQLETARKLYGYLKNSDLQKNVSRVSVQDPYSFRCIPQVHGASKDCLNYVTSVVETEINSVTDNPTVFPDEELVLSGGNFHGQPLALAMDFLAIGISELASISERRVYRLISGERRLPPFLVANPGLNSGFMIPQYTAASLVSQNKQLCTPASVDSISSSNEQEDHVSMGANAATKLLNVVSNTERVLAIEMFAASQAISFREPHKPCEELYEYLNDFRKEIPTISEDTIMYLLINKSHKFLFGNRNNSKKQNN